MRRPRFRASPKLPGLGHPRGDNPPPPRVLGSGTFAVAGATPSAKGPPLLAQQGWDFTQNTQFCLQRPQLLLHPSLPTSWHVGDIPPPGNPHRVSAAFLQSHPLHPKHLLRQYLVEAERLLPPRVLIPTHSCHIPPSPCLLSPLPRPASDRPELDTTQL